MELVVELLVQLLPELAYTSNMCIIVEVNPYQRLEDVHKELRITAKPDLELVELRIESKVPFELGHITITTSLARHQRHL